MVMEVNLMFVHVYTTATIVCRERLNSGSLSASTDVHKYVKERGLSYGQ